MLGSCVSRTDDGILGSACTVSAYPGAPICYCGQHAARSLLFIRTARQLCCLLYTGLLYLIHLVHVSTLRFLAKRADRRIDGYYRDWGAPGKGGVVRY